MKYPQAKILMALAMLFFGAGCGRKEKEVTDLQRKEAAFLVTEADFAITLRDYPRAESVLNKVVGLVPDNGAYWSSLGTVRKRMGNAGGAREAYRAALRAFETQASKQPTESDPVLKQISLLALLGQVSDARALTEKLMTRFPGDREARLFVEDKRLDQMLADPMFKELMP